MPLGRQRYLVKALASVLLVLTMFAPWATPRAAAATACAATVNEKDALTIDAGDTADAFPEIESKLNRGLTVTIVSEATLPARQTTIFGCKIYYDLWDETHYVSVLSGSVGAAGEARKIPKRGDAMRLCYRTTMNIKIQSGDVNLTTYLDPVSDEVLARTRQWLAEKGISSSSGALIGRAAYAIMDLKQQAAITRRCAIGRAP